MSSVQITFRLKALDFSPITRGTVIVPFTRGGVAYSVELRLTTNVATRGFFQEVAWNGTAAREAEQADNYAFAANRDYRTLLLDNVTNPLLQPVFAVNNVVTINIVNATIGTPTYTGNVLDLVIGTPSNDPEEQPAVLAVDLSPTVGDCSTIQYTVSATGDGGPWRLLRGTTLIDAAYDGSNLNLNLERSSIQRIILQDSTTQEELTSKQVNVPSAISAENFSINVVNFALSSDITILQDVVIAGTTPLQYSLENDTDAVAGTNYQTSNVFGGVANGVYKVFIRDVYGCAVSKVFSVSGVPDASTGQVAPYFEVMEGQSFIFYPITDFTATKKKNYFNTGSRNEYVEGAKYCLSHYVDVEDEPYFIQFKSSYDFHYITLFNSDDSKVDLPPLLISENIGVEEEFDCVVFSISGTQSGVYFNGGNQYTPSTDTVIAPSPYTRILPVWGRVEGQLVYVNDAAFRIKGTGNDADRGSYFIIDLVTTTEAAGRVRTTWNKQGYNLYEFKLDPAVMSSRSFIVMEKGYNSDGLIVEPRWISENLEIIDDADEILFLEGSDTKNRAGIVFQSGIDVRLRIRGEIEFVPFTNSEVSEGDSQVYDIEQMARQDFRLIFEELTARQVNQLNIVTALSGFKCNGVALRPKERVDAARIDKSNLYTWERLFGFGDNQLAEEQDETVLSPSTGVEGGGSTGRPDAIDISNITLYEDEGGNLVQDEDGNLIKT